MRKYYEYFINKYSLRIVTGVIIALVIGSITLSVHSARDMKRLISEDFNLQQVVDLNGRYRGPLKT